MYPSTYVQYFCSFSFTKSTTEWTSKYVFIGALSIMEVLNKYVWSCTLSDIWHKNVNVYSCYIFFKIALPSSTHHVLSLSYNLLMYPKVNFTLLKWRYTPQPSWGHSMPLNPSVPLLLLLSNLQTFSEACADFLHLWSCHCMFITHSAWPWENAWTQDMTGDTHTLTHTQS